MSQNLFRQLKTFGFGSERGIPSLDGLRAVSISLVLFAHLLGTRGFIPYFYSPLGEFGVRVFFVISGYLITSILLKELKREGSISLKRFYFRRSMRLFPAAYAFIAIIALLASLHFLQLEHRDLKFALTYTANFNNDRGWNLGHLWSLAVEEQFYLLWPFTLWMLGPARSGRFLFGVLAAAPLLRLASPFFDPAFNFVIWSDALATGCLLALFRAELASHPIYARILRSRWFFLVPSAAVLANYVPSTKLQWLFCGTIMNVCIAASVDWAMRNPAGRCGRVLNYPAVAFLGVLSYSLYLWQQPFLERASSSVLCSFPLNVVLALAAALLSYLCIECPFLRLRAALERAVPARHDESQALGTAPELGTTAQPLPSPTAD